MKIFGLYILRHRTLEKMCKDEYTAGVKKGYDMSDQSYKSVINPVIHDLDKLRADTWNQDKITHMQNWLRNNGN